MQNNTLLYILPDVTYFAELLPTKKEFTFAIQNFRQINGEFLGDNTFEAENIDKLFGKLKDTAFTSLILPDYLFTDTIVSVKETDEKKVIAHLKDELLPSLGITTDSHYVNTFVLAQFKGESKVQISALEKSVLAPIRVSAKKHGISFDGVTALSWSMKSLISLEPSISIVQAGSKLYTALHYIGIDQTTVAELDETSNISETIKTLKGGEPSIQTIYLLSNEVVEESLKEELKATVPIQQVASFKEEDTKIPSYVKQLIEAGMKTLSIPDYLAPSFEVSKPLADDEETIAALPQGDTDETKNEQTTESEVDDDEADTEDADESPEKEIENADDLPTPTVPAATAVQVKALDLTLADDDSNAGPEKEDNDSLDESDESETIEPITAPDDHEEPSEDTEDENEKAIEESPKIEEKSVPTTPEEKKKEDDMPEAKEELKEVTDVAESESDADDVIDLRQFSNEGSLEIEEETADEPKKKKNPDKVLKNQSGVGSMMKMVFITVAVFFATVAIGVGVGLGLLKVTQQDQNVTPAVETAEASPEPSPSPEPEIVETFDPSEGYSVLVVNATTKAGYAGTIKSELVDAELDDVDAANAKGEYDEGNFILVDEEIPGLAAFLKEATDLTFEVDTENKAQEDASEAYDFVVVLAK